MRTNYRLLFGPLAAAIFAVGITGLARLIPGYSHVHQTVSEIGEIASPARLPFAIMLFCVAACILVFAWALRDSVGCDSSLATGRIPNRIHGRADCRHSHLRLSASASQRFRHFRTDWISSAAGLRANVETRRVIESSGRILVGTLCASMDRNRSKLKLVK
jgi:hypothetical protein